MFHNLFCNFNNFSFFFLGEIRSVQDYKSYLFIQFSNVFFLLHVRYFFATSNTISNLRENDINFFPPTPSKLHTLAHIWPTRKIWNCILSYEKLCNFIKILYESLNPFFFVLHSFSIVFKFVFLFFLNVIRNNFLNHSKGK